MNGYYDGTKIDVEWWSWLEWEDEWERRQKMDNIRMEMLEKRRKKTFFFYSHFIWYNIVIYTQLSWNVD